MLEQLTKLLPQIHADIFDGNVYTYDKWDSLIVNKRKPHTYRVFRRYEDLRVCLHRFDPCEADECFAHPHPWPGAFLLLKGEYVHTIGYSKDLESGPDFLYREIARDGHMYEITNKQTWHSVQPTQVTYTVMVNGPEWEGHSKTRTTKGKDLDKMSDQEMKTHFVVFNHLLKKYLDGSLLG